MISNIDVKKICYNLLVVMVLMYSFIIWNNSYNINYASVFYRNNQSIIEMISNFFRYGLYLYILIIIFISKETIKKKDSIFILSLFIFFLIKHNKDTILQIIIFLGILILINNKQYLNEKYVNRMLSLSIIGIIVQLYFFNYGGYRRTLSITDTNFSSYIIFLLVILLHKLKRKTCYLALFLGFLGASRSYLLSTIIYFLGDFFLVRSKRKIDYKIVAVSIFLLTCFISFLYLFFFDNVKGYDNSISRVFNFIDGSNRIRFESFISTLLIIFTNFKVFAIGILKGELENTYGLTHTPHNTLLRLFLDNGAILGTFIYFYINNLFFKNSTVKALPLIISLFIYQAFLPINYANINMLTLTVIFII